MLYPAELRGLVYVFLDFGIATPESDQRRLLVNSGPCSCQHDAQRHRIMATVSMTGNQKPAKLCPEFPLTLTEQSMGEKDREQGREKGDILLILFSWLASWLH
jgi:hypothetical protein